MNISKYAEAGSDLLYPLPPPFPRKFATASGGDLK